MTPGAVPAFPGPVLCRPCPPRQRTRRQLPALPAVVPEWAQNPPPLLDYARLAYAKVRGGTDGSRETAIAAGVALYAAWYVLTLQPWVPDLAAALLWLTAVGYGVTVVWLCQAGAAPWRWTQRTATIATVVTFLLGGLWLLAGNPFLTAVVAVGAAQAFAHRPGSVREVKWWSHERIAGALVDAKVLALDSGGLPTIGYLGKPVTDEHGTWVTFRLPPGNTWQQVRKRQAELASALGLPADRVHVEHDPAQPAGAVTIGVQNDRDSSPVPATMPERTRWQEPFRIGQDARGRELRLDTHGTNDLFGGIPNSGKTTAVRLQLAHYLLDPSTTLFGADGKGSRKDYGRVADLARRWVWGTSPDATGELLTLLREVLAVVHWRNEHSDREPDGGWPGMLVLLEELQEIRAGADGKQAEELDVLLGRCIRLGRAVNVKILVSTQRPVKDDVPSGVRNLVAQQVCLKVRGVEDARIVLGQTPDLPLPTRTGQAILGLPGGQVAGQVDYLDLAAFADVCDRAAALRAQEPTVPLLPLDAPEPVELPQVDTFSATVRRLLADGPMEPTALREALPEDMRETSPRALALRLATVPGIRPGKADGRRVYRLEASLGTPGTLVGGVMHAQTGQRTAVGALP